MTYMPATSLADLLNAELATEGIEGGLAATLDDHEDRIAVLEAAAP